MIRLPEPQARILAAILAAMFTISGAFAEETAPASNANVIVDMSALDRAPAPEGNPSRLPLEPPPEASAIPDEIAEPTRDSDLLPPAVSAFSVPGAPPSPANATVPAPLPEQPGVQPSPAIETLPPAPEPTPQVAQETDGNVAEPAADDPETATAPETEPSAEAAPEEVPPIPTPTQENVVEEAPGNETVAAPEAGTEPAPESVSEPETEEQAPEEPTAEEPTAEEPTAEEPTAEEPTAEEPTAEEPTAEEAAGEATEEQPIAEEPAPEEAAEEAAEEAPPEEPAEPDPNAPAPAIPEGGVRITYPAGEKNVPTEAYAILDELAGRMTRDEGLRLQVECFAAGEKETEGKARRLSLIRCIAIRQYMIERDIRSTRMDIRALGFKSEGQPVDRVDIIPAPEGL